MSAAKQRAVKVECHFITHIRNEMLMGNHSPDEYFTSAHGDVALEMHLWTVSKPEHGKQCGIRYTGASIVYEFRHSHFHGAALQSKQVTISGSFPLSKRRYNNRKYNNRCKYKKLRVFLLILLR